MIIIQNVMEYIKNIINNKEIVIINLPNSTNYHSLVQNHIKGRTQIKVWNVRLAKHVVFVTNHMSNRKISINGSYKNGLTLTKNTCMDGLSGLGLGMNRNICAQNVIMIGNEEEEK